MNIQHVQVTVDHERLRPRPMDHLVPSDRRVRLVPLFLRLLQQYVHHGLQKACGAANFHVEIFSQGLDGLGTTWDKVCVLAETVKLHGDEVLEHVVYVGLVGVFAVLVKPPLTHFGVFCDGLWGKCITI